MELDFRKIEHRLCIVLDEVIPGIFCLGEKTEANALLCYGYVDKHSGLTFEILSFMLYVDGDYTIINVNKDVNMKIRAESHKNKEIIPINNVALLKHFEKRINMIEKCYYNNDCIEEMRDLTELDEFRHQFYPDDVKALMLKDDAKPEKIWVRLTDYIINPLTHEKFFEGSLLNSPFDKNYNLSEGDSVYLSIVDCVGKKLLLIIPKPTE